MPHIYLEQGVNVARSPFLAPDFYFIARQRVMQICRFNIAETVNLSFNNLLLSLILSKLSIRAGTIEVRISAKQNPVTHSYSQLKGKEYFIYKQKRETAGGPVGHISGRIRHT